MFVYIRKDELLGVFGLLIHLFPLPVSLAGKKLSKCRHPSTFALFLFCTLRSKCVLINDWSPEFKSLSASGATLVPLLLEDPAQPEYPLQGFAFFFSFYFFQQKIIKKKKKQKEKTVGFLSLYQLCLRGSSCAET